MAYYGFIFTFVSFRHITPNAQPAGTHMHKNRTAPTDTGKKSNTELAPAKYQTDWKRKMNQVLRATTSTGLHFGSSDLKFFNRR